MTLNSNFVSIFRRYLSVAWEGFPDVIREVRAEPWERYEPDCRR